MDMDRDAASSANAFAFACALRVARASREGARVHYLVAEEGDAFSVRQRGQETGAHQRPREDLHEDSQPAGALRCRHFSFALLFSFLFLFYGISAQSLNSLVA